MAIRKRILTGDFIIPQAYYIIIIGHSIFLKEYIDEIKKLHPSFQNEFWNVAFKIIG